MKKCKECVVNAACTKKEYDGSLCKDITTTIIEKIISLREEADNLEARYGLEYYFYKERTKDMTVEQLMVECNYREKLNG